MKIRERKNKIIIEMSNVKNHLHFVFIVPTVSANELLTLKVGVYENSPKIFTDDKGNASGFWPDIIEYIALQVRVTGVPAQ